jgi:hypothetical protein
MRRKPSFYCSRRSLVVRPWSLVVRPWSLVVGNAMHRHRERSRGMTVGLVLTNDERPTTNDRLYPGLSRCTTFTRYPALRKPLDTSSAIMTERCCPPVQPKEIVR